MPLTQEEFDYLNSDNTRKSAIDYTLDQVSGLEPDKHAEIFQLSESQDELPDIVKTDVNEFKRRENIKNLDTQDIVDNYPITAKFLSNPRNASVVYDQLDILKGLEEYTRDNPFEVGGKRLANRLATLSGNFMQFIGKTVDTALLESTDVAALGREISDPENLFKITPNVSWEQFKAEPSVGGLATLLVENVPSMGADILAGVFGTPIYATAIMQEVAEERMVNLREEGDPTWSELAKSALPALAIAYTEKFAGKFALGQTGRKVTGFKSGARATGVAAGYEGIQEFGQEGIQYLGETVGTKKDVEMLEMLDRQIQGLVIGAGAGAGIRGTTATVEAIANRNTAHVSNIIISLDEQSRIDKIVELAQSNDLNERTPAEFKQFLQSLEGQEIIVSADVLNQLDSPSEYLEQLQAEPGADVGIPLEEFVTKVAPLTDVMNELRPHLRMSEDGLTALQIESGEHTDTFAIRNLMKNAEKEKAIKTEADAIYEQVQDQIIATGRQGTQTARISAQLIPAYVTQYVARARKLGHEVGVQEVYEKMGLKIVGPLAPTRGQVILNQATEAGYEGQSPMDANEWVGATDKGLPMDEESRRIRAQQMEQEFDPTKAYDPNFTVDPVPVTAQDFGDIKIVQDVRVQETGETVTMTENAQDVWNDVQSRKSKLEQLLDCLNA